MNKRKRKSSINGNEFGETKIEASTSGQFPRSVFFLNSTVIFILLKRSLDIETFFPTINFCI